MDHVHILAVASGGGHWEQLLMIRKALDSKSCCFATTSEDIAKSSDVQKYIILPDCNFRRIFATIHCLYAALMVIRKLKPEYVISTGAAPGLLCIAVGKLFGAKTVWIDSVANAEKMSLSGRIARPFSDYWLTQWEHLAKDNGPKYEGSVL